MELIRITFVFKNTDKIASYIGPPLYLKDLETGYELLYQTDDCLARGRSFTPEIRSVLEELENWVNKIYDGRFFDPFRFHNVSDIDPRIRADLISLVRGGRLDELVRSAMRLYRGEKRRVVEIFLGQSVMAALFFRSDWIEPFEVDPFRGVVTKRAYPTRTLRLKAPPEEEEEKKGGEVLRDGSDKDPLGN